MATCAAAESSALACRRFGRSALSASWRQACADTPHRADACAASGFGRLCAGLPPSAAAPAPGIRTARLRATSTLGSGVIQPDEQRRRARGRPLRRQPSTTRPEVDTPSDALSAGTTLADAVALPPGVRINLDRWQWVAFGAAGVGCRTAGQRQYRWWHSKAARAERFCSRVWKLYSFFAIVYDAAVEHAVTVRRIRHHGARIVRGKDKRRPRLLVETLHDLHGLLAVGRIEMARWLVGQHYERPRRRRRLIATALLLSAAGGRLVC